MIIYHPNQLNLFLDYKITKKTYLVASYKGNRSVYKTNTTLH